MIGARAPDLSPLLAPRGIAVVGASPEAEKLAGRPLVYLLRHGFRGGIYPVNPRHTELAGLRCYASPLDLPDPVDLALVMVPQRAVVEAVEACGRRGIRFAIVVASGFAEAGHAEAQAALIRVAREHGIRLVGPNCVGVLVPGAGVTATFSTVVGRRMPKPGGIALVTQSGALGNSLLQSWNELGIGLHSWVSTGNEADLGALDLVEHLLNDPSVSAIGLFLEGLKDGSRLVPLGRAARARRKPIIAVRAGRSDLGRTASVSHTGKLAGSVQVWRDVARQAGLVEVETIDDLVDLCLALEAWGPSRDGRAPGLGVLTVSGGLGVMISDACADEGVALPRFAADTQARLRELLPSQSAVANPVDTALFADETGYARCAEIVLEDAGVGRLLLILTSLAHDYDSLTKWLETLAPGAKAKGKAVAVSFLSSVDTLAPDMRRRLLDAGALVLPNAHRAVSVLGHLRRLEDLFRSGATQPPAVPAATSGERTAEAFLAYARVPLAPQRLCRTVDDAVSAAAELGYPLALKAASPDLPHKTEAGGVALRLASAEEVRAAWRRITRSVAEKAPHARLDGLVAQRMVDGGVDFILGCSVDPEFGRLVMVGAGGIWAEVLDDVAFAAVPVTPEECAAMVRRLRVFRLLEGARGGPPMDVAALEETLLALADAFHREAWVKEVDVNPLIVLPRGQGVCAVDHLVIPT